MTYFYVLALRADMIDQARQQGVEGGVTTVFWSLERDELS